MVFDASRQKIPSILVYESDSVFQILRINQVFRKYIIAQIAKNQHFQTYVYYWKIKRIIHATMGTNYLYFLLDSMVFNSTTILFLNRKRKSNNVSSQKNRILLIQASIIMTFPQNRKIGPDGLELIIFDIINKKSIISQSSNNN